MGGVAHLLHPHPPPTPGPHSCLSSSLSSSSSSHSRSGGQGREVMPLGGAQPAAAAAAAVGKQGGTRPHPLPHLQEGTTSQALQTHRKLGRAAGGSSNSSRSVRSLGGHLEAMA